MKSRTTALICSLLCSATTYATDAVLIAQLPAGVTPAHALAITKQAFIGRQWTVAKTDANSVTGELDHREYDSRLKIYIAGNTLRYDDKGSMVTLGDGSDHRSSTHTLKTKSPAPTMWLDNLRLDISTMLASVAPPTATTPTVADRLKSLVDLRDAGLVTDAEYAAKRAEIMKGI